MSGGYSSLARRRELSPDVSGPHATHPLRPPKSRHVDSFTPAQSVSRPSRLPGGLIRLRPQAHPFGSPHLCRTASRWLHSQHAVFPSMSSIPMNSIDSLVPTNLICYHYRRDRPSRSFPRLDCRSAASRPRSVRRRNGCEATVGLSNRYQCDEVAVRSSEPCQARGNVTDHGNNIVTIYRTSFLD